MWFNSISELPFYNPSIPCYCENLVLPNDLILQGSFPKVNTILGFIASLRSPDGLTEYELLDGYFDIYYFEFDGRYWFNARLRRFSPEMCNRKCWIIQFEVLTDTIGKAFNKYTQRYCTATCCETASGVTFSQSGITTVPDLTKPTNPVKDVYTNDCGDEIIRLISRYPCYDPFSDVFYGTPQIIVGGNPASFEFTKITSLIGRFVARPREITKEISYNCKVQRVESTQQYLLESFELYPQWKMTEIEGQLHAPFIWIETASFYTEKQFAGGVAFAKPDGARDCTETFKLTATMQDCTIRQIYGCDETCANNNYNGYSTFFVVPQGYVGGNFYGDNKTLIASDVYSLADWFMSQQGIYQADVLVVGDTPSPALSPLPSPLTCPIDYVIGIKATGNIPTSIYFDRPVAKNRIYQSNFEDLSDVCDGIIPVSCPMPVIGTVTEIANPCPTPTIGTITETPVTPNTVDVIQYVPDGWQLVLIGSPAIADGTNASVYEGQVKFNLKVRNYNYPAPDVDFLVANEMIGILGANGRPSVLRFLNSENNASLTVDQFITVDESGLIRYSGPISSVSLGSYSELLLTDLVFNI